MTDAPHDPLATSCIITLPSEAPERLRNLGTGLSMDLITSSVSAGDSQRKQKTSPQYPRNYASIVAWAETLAELRRQLIRLQVGWATNSYANYETVYLSQRRVSIAVAGGNRATGALDLGELKLARKRGPMTTDRVRRNADPNQMAFDLGVAFEPREKNRKSAPADLGCFTWFLVVFADAEEVRLELALPLGIGGDRIVSAWAERILLPALPISGAVLPVDPHQDDDDDDPLVTRN